MIPLKNCTGRFCNTVDRALDLHAANPGFIPRNPSGPLSLQGAIQVCRARSNPWALPHRPPKKLLALMLYSVSAVIHWELRSSQGHVRHWRYKKMKVKKSYWPPFSHYIFSTTHLDVWPNFIYLQVFMFSTALTKIHEMYVAWLHSNNILYISVICWFIHLLVHQNGMLDHHQSTRAK